jgi:hypothetical protein
VAQPTNQSLISFEAQIKKSSRWFWGPNYQTRAVGFEAQTGKPSTTLVLRLNQETVDFEIKPEEIVVTSFKTKLEKTIVTGFEAKPAKTITGFEAKPPETVAAGFEDKPTETVTAGFETKPLETVIIGFDIKPVKTVRVVLRSNHS